MKKLMFVTGIITLLALFSCDFSDDSGSPRTRMFKAKDLTSNKDYELKAELLAEGKYCNVWVERGSGAGKDEAKRMAKVYDDDIYQKMMDAFGNYFSEYGSYDTMSIADEIGDMDGKLCILLLDIKDGYKGVNDSYVAGYFWAGNFFNLEGSNLCDMIYVDTNPGVPGSEESNKTVAHEMQHLMNFVTTLFIRNKVENGQIKEYYPMDVWIDEGLASAAEYVYSGKIDQERVSWFNHNGAYQNGTKVMSGLIDKGNNFFVWGNHEDEKTKHANLDDYATVYLFFQWLRLQGSHDIYKKIITSKKSDYNAVVENINISGGGGNSWDSLLETWLAANRIKSSTNQYGYKGVSELNVNVTYAPTSVTSVALYPGEAVYSLANTSPSTTASTNIVYKYITSIAVSGSHSANSTLLTYNKNTEIEGTSENGTVTGVAPAVSVRAASEGRSAGLLFRPYRVDARDVLRRNGGEQQNYDSVDLSNFSKLKRISADE